MDGDKSNKPAHTPGLKPPDPWKMVKIKWPHSNRQKSGGTVSPRLEPKNNNTGGRKRETKLPNKRKNVEPQGKDHTTLPSGGVRSAPGATRFNILSYKQVLNVKITFMLSGLDVIKCIPISVSFFRGHTHAVGSTNYHISFSPRSDQCSTCFLTQFFRLGLGTKLFCKNPGAAPLLTGHSILASRVEIGPICVANFKSCFNSNNIKIASPLCAIF
jgi:hypothetical protein